MMITRHARHRVRATRLLLNSFQFWGKASTFIYTARFLSDLVKHWEGFQTSNLQYRSNNDFPSNLEMAVLNVRVKGTSTPKEPGPTGTGYMYSFISYLSLHSHSLYCVQIQCVRLFLFVLPSLVKNFTWYIGA